MYQIIVFYPKHDKPEWWTYCTSLEDAVNAAKSIERGEKRKGGKVVLLTPAPWRNETTPFDGYEDALKEYQAWSETQ